MNNPDTTFGGRLSRTFDAALSELDLNRVSKPTRLALELFLLAMLLAGSWSLVYYTGGTSQVSPHIFYVPILLGALFFGIGGGVLTAVAAGILCGPFMPFDVASGQLQSDLNWPSRAAFFIGIGGLAGMMCEMLRKKADVLQGHTRRSTLSGLPNQVALEEHLDARIRTYSGKETPPFLVAEIGISDLEQVIATFGRRRADQLVARIGKNLHFALSSMDTIYHTHADRFAVVVDEAEVGDLDRFCESFVESVRQPVELSDLPVLMTGRLGVARYPTHGQNGEELTRASSFALRMAEARKRRYMIFDKAHDVEQRRCLEQLTELRRAIDQFELIFHYQPKLDLRSGKVTSAEALVRWPHPSGKLLSPGAFLPAAENTTLITRLSAWGLEAAITQLSAWQRDGIHLNLGVAVNLSAMDLQDGSTVATLEKLLALYDVDPARLEIEVTETTVIEDIEAATHCLSQIQGLGVRVAIDDFGTGHAGLSQLRTLPVDALKIDRTFVAKMLTNQTDDLIVRSSIDLGHNLGLEVVAEGVETVAVMERLRDYGCDIVQGYGIAKPMAETDLRGWLQQRA